MLRRSFLKLIGGSAFGMLGGTSIAQSRVGLAHKAASGVSAATAGSLFQQGTDVSPIRPAFAGPVCAKGRVTPEFEDFCDGTKLTFTGWNGTVEWDSRRIAGTQSTKLINTRNDTLEAFFTTDSIDPALDLRHKSLMIRIFIPPENHNVSLFNLRFRTGFAQAYIRLWSSGAFSPRTGWLEFTVLPSQIYVKQAGFDLSAVNSIRIELQKADGTKPCYILLNGVTIWDGRLKMPLYCCTFDDNYIRQYEAAKYAIGKGIPVSLFINKNYSDGYGVGGNHTGMKLTQNQELAHLGCIHINHGLSHSPPKMTTEEHKTIDGFASSAGGTKTQLAVPNHGYQNGDSVLITGTTNYNAQSIAIESADTDTFIIPKTYIAESPCGKTARLTTVNNLWSNAETSVKDLIADIEANRQWMAENGLGFGSHIFGSPQEWWLEHHEQHLRPYIFGRPRQGAGMGGWLGYGLLTMWDENTEVRSACDTHLDNAYKMLQANFGTLLWTPGTYPQGTLREWTDGGIYEVTNPAGTSETPAHSDWTYLRQRGDEDQGDRAIQIDVWHHYASHPDEGTLQAFKDYMDVVAAHIAAGRLRAVDLRDLYENYLYTTTPPDRIPGDIDGDGKVDLNDFTIMAENWLKEKNGN